MENGIIGLICRPVVMASYNISTALSDPLSANFSILLFHEGAHFEGFSGENRVRDLKPVELKTCARFVCCLSVKHLAFFLVLDDLSDSNQISFLPPKFE